MYVYNTLYFLNAVMYMYLPKAPPCATALRTPGFMLP